MKKSRKHSANVNSLQRAVRQRGAAAAAQAARLGGKVPGTMRRNAAGSRRAGTTRCNAAGEPGRAPHHCPVGQNSAQVVELRVVELARVVGELERLERLVHLRRMHTRCRALGRTRGQRGGMPLGQDTRFPRRCARGGRTAPRHEAARVGARPRGARPAGLHVRAPGWPARAQPHSLPREAAVAVGCAGGGGGARGDHESKTFER